MKPFFHTPQSPPIAMLTTYDAPTAKIAHQAGVDILLVGDSLGPNMLGYASVHDVTVEDMCHHVAAVRRGAPEAYIIADLPFCSVQSTSLALHATGQIIAAGADSVKLETEREALPILSALIAADYPVCAHIGYTPQTPGLAVAAQGKDTQRAQELLDVAREVEKRGAFMVVLELIPTLLAERISQEITIPTIGIGAGPHCAGQVQVFYDIAGYGDTPFRHAKKFGAVKEGLFSAFQAYSEAVHTHQFPTTANAATLDQSILNTLE